MGGHFKSKVDRLLTEFSLEAVTGSVKKCINSKNKEIVTDVSPDRMDLSIESLPKKLTQCRICHDDDEDSNMEAPCSCRGNLKVSSIRPEGHELNYGLIQIMIFVKEKTKMYCKF
ncbi:armadillo-type fold protein [Tanacetum coccineum]